MSPEEIRQLVRRLDTTSDHEQERAWELLRDLRVEVVPYLAEAYGSFRKWQGRGALVFHSIRYARVSGGAYRLGIEALADKATLVRYRACGLLAYSQRREAIPHLRKLLDHSDVLTVEDVRAAIDAISHGNHHYFIDRKHTDRTFWVVNEGENSPPPTQPWWKIWFATALAFYHLRP